MPQSEAEIQAALEAAAAAPVKVIFDAAQQERVNELIQESQRRAAKDVRAELVTTKETLATAQTELAAAKAAAAKATPAKKEAAGDAVVELQAKLDALVAAQDLNKIESDRLKAVAARETAASTEAKALLASTRRTSAITAIASSHGFVDPAEVVELTEKFVVTDEAGKHTIVDASGNARVNPTTFEPMTMDEFYAEFGAKKPYMVKSTVIGGAGSKPGTGTAGQNGRYLMKDVFGKTGNGALAQQLYKTNLAEYKRLQGEARASGVIA